MIRINKKIKKVKDEYSKKVDENTEIDKDSIGAIRLIKWLKDHRKVNDQFNFISESKFEEETEFDLDLIKEQSNNES